MDFLGDLGGVFEIFFLVFGFLVFPVSEFAFNLHAVKTLYLARTGDENLLSKDERPPKKTEQEDPQNVD